MASCSKCALEALFNSKEKGTHSAKESSSGYAAVHDALRGSDNMDDTVQEAST